MLGLVDAGAVPYAVQKRGATLRPAAVGEHTAYVADEPFQAQVILAGRVVLLIQAAPGSGIGVHGLDEVVEGVGGAVGE